jgi:hypothetical protein
LTQGDTPWNPSSFSDQVADVFYKQVIDTESYNANSEMSQRVRQIHRNLVIADQWIEPHNPWQNPAELNGVKYLKSHAHVLLDRKGAPDSMWFLAQDYLGHVQNLSANRQINWQIPQQVSRVQGGHQIFPILLYFVNLNLFCI